MAPVSAGHPAPRLAPLVGLVGVNGYGTVHLREIARLAGLGWARLVCCADVARPGDEQSGIISRLGAKYFPDWQEMLAAQPDLDVLVIASPLHLHQEMALAAFESGAHVLLEKPPAVSSGSFSALVDAKARAGVLCQVGFQSAGSGALAKFGEIVLGDDVGHPKRVAATGSWQRDRRYWTRSEWAGKESLRGVTVGDGAISNPFAHAVMNCLVAVGAGAGASLEAVVAERYRANPIEVEDTACMRVTVAGGASFVMAVTLCAEQTVPATLQVSGPRGTVAWAYEADTIGYDLDGRSWEENFVRRSLLEELLAAVDGRDGAAGLSCPLERTRPFVEVVEAVHSEPVRTVRPEHVRWENDAGTARAVIAGVGSAIQQAAATGQLFSEQGVAWATCPAPGED